MGAFQSNNQERDKYFSSIFPKIFIIVVWQGPKYTFDQVSTDFEIKEVRV